MASTQVVFDVELTTISCGHCGGTYAINERYRKQKHEEGGSWNCPYCQIGWGYSSNGENAKLKRELEAERKRREWFEKNARSEREARETTQRRLIAQRGASTRLRNRIKNGVCPCCTRTFVNLKQHMTTQHPDFKAGEE